MRDRVRQRLEHQVTCFVVDAEQAYEDKRPDFLTVAVRIMGGDPSVLRAKISDPRGNILYVSAGEASQVRLDPSRTRRYSTATPETSLASSPIDGNRWEAIKPIYFAFDLRGYAWVESNPALGLRAGLRYSPRHVDLRLPSGSPHPSSLVWLVSQLITRPLAVLHHGTRALATHPESSAAFPLPVIVKTSSAI